MPAYKVFDTEDIDLTKPGATHCYNFLDHLVVDQMGDLLVLEKLESPITGSLVKVCSTAATHGAEVHRGGVEAVM